MTESSPLSMCRVENASPATYLPASLFPCFTSFGRYLKAISRCHSVWQQGCHITGTMHTYSSPCSAKPGFSPKAIARLLLLNSDCETIITKQRL